MKHLRALLLLCLTVPAYAAETVLLPQPCRVMDTRTWSGAIPSGGTLAFSLSPTASASQGGTIGCGIPETATGAILLVHAAPTAANGGFLKIYDAVIEPSQVFASTTFTAANQYQTVQLSVPFLGAAQTVGIWAQVTAHAVVDVAGWLEPCVPEDVWDLTYQAGVQSEDMVGWTITSNSTDLAKYAAGGKIWIGGAASQPGLYEIVFAAGEHTLWVYPPVESATDAGREVHLLSGGCSPREVLLDGFDG